MKKVILITGASSGFGYQLALTLLEKGHTVYAGARRLQAMDALKEKGAHTFQLDVTDDASVKKMVDTLLKNETRLDAVYTNAGYGDYGVIEEPELEKIKAMYEVNVFGVARVHNAVLPFLRKQGFGRLIITSSLVGHISIPGFGWYASTKHAIRAMSEALRMELKPFNISVYHDLIESFKAFIKKGYQKAPGMDSTVKAMVHAFEAKSPKWVYRTTKDAKGFPILKGFIGLKAYSKTAYNLVIKSKKKA